MGEVQACFYFAVESGFPLPRTVYAPSSPRTVNWIVPFARELDDVEATSRARWLHAYAHALEREDTVAGFGRLYFEAAALPAQRVR